MTKKIKFQFLRSKDLPQSNGERRELCGSSLSAKFQIFLVRNEKLENQSIIFSFKQLFQFLTSHFSFLISYQGPTIHGIRL